MENEVIIEEVFNASPERVFEAWTDPEKLVKWYAPEGCTIHFKKIDISEGGRFHSCISNPQFGDCWCVGEYKEIIAGKKLVFTLINANADGKPINPASIGMDPNWPGETLVIITLRKKAEGPGYNSVKPYCRNWLKRPALIQDGYKCSVK